MKMKRSKCEICKGKGWYYYLKALEFIPEKVDCDYCEPDDPAGDPRGNDKEHG